MADPQVNPNALGAPTEGFGQTVTFAFDPRGVTPSLQLAESTPHGGGIQGAGRAQLTDVREPPPLPRDNTAAILLKAGAELLQPYVEEQRNQKFVEGVQRAMNGEAAKDIQTQRPWYSRIFGDTPAVAGARAYEVQAKVNEIVSTQTANMDQLRTLGPDQAAKHFSGLINQHMTGDAMSDSLVAKAMLEQLPSLMKAQAKAYHGYTQGVAVKASAKNMATAGDALQQAGQLYSEDTMNDADMALRKKAYIAAIMPPDGINEENYMKLLSSHIREAADKGQFHVISALRESGAFDAMTPEQQNTANKAIDTAATHYRDRYAFKYAREIAELKSDAANLPAGMTPKDIAGRYDKMNTAYQKLTGSPVGLFTSDEVANGLAGTMNYLKSEEKAALAHNATLANHQAKADEKELAAAQLDLEVKRHIAGGTVFLAGTLTKATKDQIDTAAYKMFNDPENAQVGTDLLRNNFVRGGYVNPIMKQEFEGLVRSSEGRDAPTADFFAAVDKYSRLSQGAGSTALADAYFGDYAPRINRFLRMTGGDMQNANVADAFTAAMDRKGDMKAQPIDGKQRKQLLKDVANTEPGRPRWLGGVVKMREDTLDALASIAEQNVEDWRGVGGVPDAEAVKRGVQGAISSGKVEVLGGFAIRRGAAGMGSKTLRELASNGPDGYVAIPAGREDAYFETFLNEKLKLAGADPSGASVVIHHAGQAAGTDQFAVTVSKDGHTVMQRFTAAEFQRYAAQATKTDTTPPEKSVWQYGPALNYNPGNAPGTPSPYASAEKWAAFRAEQSRKAKPKQ